MFIAAPPKTHSTSSRTQEEYAMWSVRALCVTPFQHAATPIHCGGCSRISFSLPRNMPKWAESTHRKWIWDEESEREHSHFYCTIHQWEINHRKSIKVKYAFDRVGTRGESQSGSRETLQYALSTAVAEATRREEVRRTNILCHLLNGVAAGVWRGFQIVPRDASLPSRRARRHRIPLEGLPKLKRLTSGKLKKGEGKCLQTKFKWRKVHENFPRSSATTTIISDEY